jgi:hypothetical protein
VIFAKIHYGLGNQMFQYAFARRLSIEYSTDFKLDTTFYNSNILGKSDNLREYQLSVFKINPVFTKDDEVYKFNHPSFFQRKKNKLFTLFFPYKYQNYILENNRFISHNSLNFKNDIYLNGYWQDERYFKPIENIIRDDFTFVNKLDECNNKYLDLINNSNSISIHIRRTDFISDENYYKTHGICDVSYYIQAIDYMYENVRDPHFFIFSDDLDWVKSNISIKNKHTYVNCNSLKNGFNDMRLMSNCKYHIIANSSFSWWGAWLSKHPNKIVIAPLVWNKIKSTINHVPENWIRL